MTTAQVNMRRFRSRPSGALQKAVRALIELDEAEGMGAVETAYSTVRAPSSLAEWKARGPYKQSHVHPCVYRLAGQKCPNRSPTPPEIHQVQRPLETPDIPPRAVPAPVR